MGRSQVMAAALLVTLVAGASVSEAQIIRPQRIARPAALTSVGAGWLRMPKAIHDGPSNSWWNFGDAPQYRGSVEVPVSDALALGFAMTQARMPLTYAGAPTGCANGCDANMTLQQYMGILHLGAGSSGFQEQLDLGAGITRFTNLETTSGVPLGTGKAVQDYTFSLAYGIGYGMSSRLSLFIMQEYALVMHQRVAGTPSNTAQQQTTRIGLRLALGDR